MILRKITGQMLACAAAATLLLATGNAGAKTLVYCSEGSPENFTPAINTTGTSFDAARPVYNRLTEFKRGTTDNPVSRVSARQTFLQCLN